MGVKANEPRWLRMLVGLAAVAASVGLAASMVAHPQAGVPWGWAALCLASVPAAVAGLGGWRVLPMLRVSIAGALMLVLVTSGRVDVGRMLSVGERWPYLALGCGLVFLMPVFGAARWRQLLHVHAVSVSYAESLRLVLVAFFFNTCLPGATGGDLFRAYAIHRDARKTHAAVTAVVLDRLTGLAGLMVVCLVGLALNVRALVAQPALREPAVILIGLMSAAGVLLWAVTSRRPAAWARAAAPKGLRIPGRAALGRAFEAMRAYRDAPGALAAAVGISVAAHVSTIAAVWAFGAAIGVQGLDAVSYVLLVPLGLAFNSIPVTPGGVGQGQAAMSWLFQEALPARGQQAAGWGGAVMTFVHLAMFAVGAVGGVLYALGYHRLRAATAQAEAEVHAPTEGGDDAQ